MACNGAVVSTQLIRFPDDSDWINDITFTGCAGCGGSLNEEVKGLKGHRTSVSKIMGRQLATERFTEPREAIVT